MSVLKVIPDTLGFGSGEDTAKSQNEIDKVRTRHFTVVTSDPLDGPATVLRAGELPNIGDAYATGHEGEQGLVCCRRAPRRDQDNPTVWRVEVQYGKLPVTTGGDDPGGGGDDPERPLLEIRVGSIAKSKVCSQDIHGNPVCNSVGSVFSPLPEIEEHILSLMVRRLEPDSGRITISNYIKGINSAPFMGVDPFQAMLYDVRGGRHVSDAGQLYWEVEYEFHFDADNFLVKILDRGIYKRKTEYASTEPGKLPPGITFEEACERICDANNNPVTEPVLLDGAGSPLQGAQAPYYHDFHLRKERDFGALRMPALIIQITG